MCVHLSPSLSPTVYGADVLGDAANAHIDRNQFSESGIMSVLQCDGRMHMNRVAHPYAKAVRPLVFAHRGASGEAPENTYAAFAMAVEMGADAIETDVHWTKDGVIVVAHDADVSRMTNGQGRIEELTYAELHELDFGYRFTPDGGESYPYRGKGLTIMRFRDLLQEFPDLPINVDLKPKVHPLLSQYIREVYESDGVERVMTASFHHDVLQRLRQQNTNLSTSASPREIASFLLRQRLGVGVSGKVPHQALQVPPMMYGIRVVTEGFVRAAHRASAKVHVWTINVVEEMKQLLDMGVDGIMTNHPDRARFVVDAWTPPAGQAASGATINL
ncbi:glycerophosphodiester phosphodiesterase [Alicyclobacillus mengziensis]|uniref:Glycerophosphodiester phosphodiesterase n=2 Tax=Alicyclobacillus mengziensis TaxID=2931921 RepID=A0A9X7W1R9_9BACL|nr:glycerophosphodiester phosphodiesterase [Alicyclobacillus mengziensis]